MDTMRSAPSSQVGAKRVLVVEDDYNIRGIVAKILSDLGYLVTEASDGEEGLKYADQADIILCDLVMPGMNGDEFMRRVRGNGNYVPMVVMSAVMDKDKVQRSCGAYEIVDFMEKPFKAADLAGKMSKAAAVADDLRCVRKATDKLKGFIERQNRR